MHILSRDECSLRLKHAKASSTTADLLLIVQNKDGKELSLHFWNEEMGSVIPNLSSTSKICRCNHPLNVCGFTSAAVPFYIFFTLKSKHKMMWQRVFDRSEPKLTFLDRSPQKVINQSKVQKTVSYLASIVLGRYTCVVVIFQPLLEQAGTAPWQSHLSLSYNFEFPQKAYYSPNAATGKVTVYWARWTGEEEKRPCGPHTKCCDSTGTQNEPQHCIIWLKWTEGYTTVHVHGHIVLSDIKLIHFALL